MKTTAFAFFLAAFLAVPNAFLAAPSAPSASPVSSAPPREIIVYDLRRTLDCPVSNSPAYLDVWDECHAVFTLQGIVNRDAPRLFVDYIIAQGAGQKIDVDRHWLDKFRREGQWLDSRATSLKTCASLEELVAAFKPLNLIKGVVLYDTNVAATSNLASTVAGVEDLIAVRYDPRPGSVYSRLVVSPDGPRLPVKVRFVDAAGKSLFTGTGTIPAGPAAAARPSTGSAKCDAYIWLLENYIKTGRCSGEYAGYYIDQRWRDLPAKPARNNHTLSNHDFFVSKRAFFFDLSPWGDEPATDDPAQKSGADRAVLKELLLAAYNLNAGAKFCHVGGFPPWALKYTDHENVGGRHPSVATEWEFARLLGSYNAYIDADAPALGALANASFWQHFPLQEKYPQTQPWPAREQLRQRGFLTAAGKLNPELRDKQFIIFYIGDYDSAAWLTQRMPAFWDDPARGKIPLMWCFSPVLEKRAPEVMHYCRATATPNDYFASADNGAGYLLPASLQRPRDSGLPDAARAWAAHNKPYFDRWDLTITGFVINPGKVPLADATLDAYAAFSPNGIVAQSPSLPAAFLRGDMPVMRSGLTLNKEKDPATVAKTLVATVAKQRAIPFHWFRTILRSPAWHVELMNEVHRLNPNIELLDAPTFFELYRMWLRENPKSQSPNPK